MPLAHQVILAVIVAGFVLYLAALAWAWLWTQGWSTPAPAIEAQDDSLRTPDLDQAA